jgi:glucokinase
MVLDSSILMNCGFSLHRILSSEVTSLSGKKFLSNAGVTPMFEEISAVDTVTGTKTIPSRICPPHFAHALIASKPPK